MDDSPAGLSVMVRHEVEPAIEIDLEPVDSVVVTTLIDNVTDALMTDQGPARRFAFGSGPSRPSALKGSAPGRTGTALLEGLGRSGGRGLAAVADG